MRKIKLQHNVFSITAAKISINQSSKQSYQLFCLSNEVSAAKEEEALGSSAGGYHITDTGQRQTDSGCTSQVPPLHKLGSVNLHTILGDNK
jgi:hypothetical protein